MGSKTVDIWTSNAQARDFLTSRPSSFGSRQTISKFSYQSCRRSKSTLVLISRVLQSHNPQAKEVLQMNATPESKHFQVNCQKMGANVKLIRSQFIILSMIVTLMLACLLTSMAISVEAHFGKRTQYHEQGLYGPKSYKFGYTSNEHKNPQERHEVSDGYGHVKGWYSFVDPNGQFQIVHYEAHPKYGFKVYNPKSKAYNNGKRHYNS